MVYALPEEVIVTFIIFVLLGNLNYALQSAASIVVVVIYVLLLYMPNLFFLFTADIICVEIFLLIDLNKCVLFVMCACMCMPTDRQYNYFNLLCASVIWGNGKTE